MHSGISLWVSIAFQANVQTWLDLGRIHLQLVLVPRPKASMYVSMFVAAHVTQRQTHPAWEPVGCKERRVGEEPPVRACTNMTTNK